MKLCRLASFQCIHRVNRSINHAHNATIMRICILVAFKNLEWSLHFPYLICSESFHGHFVQFFKQMRGVWLCGSQEHHRMKPFIILQGDLSVTKRFSTENCIHFAPIRFSFLANCILKSECFSEDLYEYVNALLRIFYCYTAEQY